MQSSPVSLLAVSSGSVVFFVVVAIIIGGATILGFVNSRSRRDRVLDEVAGPRGRGASTATIDSPSSETEAAPSETDAATDDATTEGATAVLDGSTPTDTAAPTAAPVEPPLAPKATFGSRLGRARESFAAALASFRARGVLDSDAWDDLEEALIRADVGVGPTTDILTAARARVAADGVTDPDALIGIVKDEIVTRLDGQRSLSLDAKPAVWLFVGVNGVGKTTTIGKVGAQMVGGGQRVVMAAGDTFRAAAAEQLGMWADRTGATLVRGDEGGDPSSVIYDAIEHAAASNADLVLADTAGRLHTKTNLMEELRKVRRVAEKGAGTVTEVLLVIDATTGQNGLVQARQFTEATDVTGVVLTKLDGSAKGGIVISIQEELGIPVKLVGLGEGVDDLVDFDAQEFVDALFGDVT